jgi:tetraacyldisaccharide 4'-kinase
MKALKVLYAENRTTATFFVLAPFLFLLSGLYLLGLCVRRFFYGAGIAASYRPAAKVISVGNMTLGGSGKTPLVEYLALELSARGKRVAVICGGYKKSALNEGPGEPAYYALGDEAAMLTENLKGRVFVVSAKNRAHAAREIDATGRFDTIILDDGFQHAALKRDLDIVALDATNPFGNGCVLPLGPLRESLSGLKRAPVICLTRVDEVSPAMVRALRERVKKLNPAACVLTAVHGLYQLCDAVSGEAQDLDLIKGKKAALLCGIAKPYSFLKTVEKCGVQVVHKSFFEDHYEYRQDDVAACLNASREAGAAILVTTQKDIVKFRGALRVLRPVVPVFVLKISLKITEGERILDERYHSLYRA